MIGVEARRTGNALAEEEAKAPARRWLGKLLFFLPLAFLWWRLIDHLRVEWTVNPQYAYGWAVPFLCTYLLWHRIQSAGQAVETTAAPHASRLSSAIFHLPSSIFYLLSVTLAVLYLPTRLIEEANPDWRLVSWALALIVVGLTLLFFRFAYSTLEKFGAFAFRNSRFRLPLENLAFPILFFLVAVPWPTLIEAPIVQALARANAAVVVEVLGWAGIPAMRHGNIIEIGNGVVGIDEACSGIRSFQAALMISLFLGEMYRLTHPRRLLLCVSGFALSFLFNLIRTGVLVTVAAKKGIGAISSWHDPAGVTILLGCFAGLWLVATTLKKRSKYQTLGCERAGPKTSPPASEPSRQKDFSRVAHRMPASSLRSLCVALIVWLALAEISTEAWYRAHEANLPPAVTWGAKFPRDNPTFRELPILPITKQLLRYDEGANGTWNEPDATRWQAIFLRWNAGRIAPHLAKNHTPEICLAAAGREVVSVSGLQWIKVHGLELPFRYYQVKDSSGMLHVFYCLWEDRAVERAFATMTLSYGNRLEPVLAGRRNSGQRSLELVIWGITDKAQALPALQRQVAKLVRVDSL